MRTIKFRAWDGKKMFMVEPVWWEESAFDYRELDYAKCMKNSGCELMQSTGLLDKNGKDIWEGDLLKHPDGFVSEVFFSKASFCIWDNTYDPFKVRTLNAFNLSKFEVVGNLYENPELVKP